MNNRQQSPPEVFEASTAGADLAKVFPAGTLGGASYINALRAPLPEVPLVPTGGVSLETAYDLIRAGAAALGVGTDLVDLAALRKGQDRLISDRARQFVQIVREARASLASVSDDGSRVAGPRTSTMLGHGQKRAVLPHRRIHGRTR